MDTTFSQIASFQYSSEAQIIKGRLEADGISVYLRDNLTIDADPLVSNAIGGVKLFVDFQDTKKAKEVLSKINNFSVADSGEAILCPNCQSNQIHYFTTITDFKSLFSFIVGFLFGTMPLYTRYEYRCESCKNKFNLNK